MRGLFLVVTSGLFLFAYQATAATPREERTALAKVTTSIKAAERLAKAKRSEDAAERFKSAADLFAEIAKAQLSEQSKPLFERVKKQLTESHGKLKQQGLELPPLEEAEFQGAPTTEPTNPSDSRGGPPSTPGKTSFVRQVAPILMQHCGKCHVRQTEGAFDASSHSSLMAAVGSNGQIVQAGAGSESPLVNLIESGEMPPEDQGDVPPEQLRTLVEWINEGAMFDGEDPSANLTTFARNRPRGGEQAMAPEPGVAQALKASPEELSAIRAELAQKNWKLALPDVAPQTADTLHLHLVGSLTAEELGALGAVAETQVDAVLKLLGGKEPSEFAKSRITLYAFDNRIDFSEFGQMVVGRPATSGQLSSSGYTIEDCYVAIVPSQDNELELAEQLALTYLREQTQGRMPEWFAAGIARTAAAKIHAKHDRVAAWRTNAPSVLAGVNSCPDLMGDKLPPESSATARFAFTETLLKHRGGVHKYLALVKDEKTPADEAFAKAYGATAEELVTRWLESVKK